MPDRACAEAASAQAAAALGPGRYLAEQAPGATLGPEGVLAELAAVLGTDPPLPVPDTPPPWPPAG